MKHFLSTPIYYPNGVPHVGHVYSTLIVDVWKRISNLLDVETFTSTGVDEHGQKVAQTARKLGRGTQEYVDIISREFFDFFNKFNISLDCWMRTTSESHMNAVSHFWQVLEKNGFIYKGNYVGWYSINDENYLQDAASDAYSSVQDPNIVWREEECYYFRLSALEDKLKQYYNEHKDVIFPKARYNEVLGFLNGGLKDFVISRPKARLYWGIPVPGDEEHVIYVWLDALVNYLSATGYPNLDYKNLWPGTHVLGKDILKFHAIYWPGMLMAAGIELPKKMIVHGWWLNNDVKISKSLDNAIDLDDLIKKYKVDGLRYFLLKSIDIGDDGSFREDLIKSVVYGDLANKFGNVFMRVLGLVQLTYGGTMPQVDLIRDNALEDKIGSLLALLPGIIENPQLITGYVHKFLECVVALNDYFQDNKIWEIKDYKTKAQHLWLLLNHLKNVSLLIYPVMPAISEEVLMFFGIHDMKISSYEKKIEFLFMSAMPKFFPKF